MPRITAHDKIGKKVRVYIRRLRGSDLTWHFGMAFAADTDEKSLEIWLMGPDGRVLVIDGQLQKAKVFVDYDLVDRETGEVLYSIRQ